MLTADTFIQGILLFLQKHCATNLNWYTQVYPCHHFSLVGYKAAQLGNQAVGGIDQDRVVVVVDGVALANSLTCTETYGSYKHLSNKRTVAPNSNVFLENNCCRPEDYTASNEVVNKEMDLFQPCAFQCKLSWVISNIRLTSSCISLRCQSRPASQGDDKRGGAFYQCNALNSKEHISCR